MSIGIDNFTKFMKKLLPRSMFGRALLILVTPLLIVQMVLGYIFFDRHTESVLRQLSTTIAGDVAMVVNWISDNPKDIKKIQMNAANYLRLDVNFVPENVLDKYGAHKDSWLYGFMTEALDNVVGKNYYLRMNRDKIFILVNVNKKGVLEVSLPRKRLFSRTTPLVLIWTTASALLLFLVASLFMRNQIRPLRYLADAADRFGRGEDPGNVKIEGALELRLLSRVFNIMRARIQKHLHERTQILASVSHDLRTPLTRMQLQLALLPEDNDHKALHDDVKQMQLMVEGFIAYAKGTASQEIRKQVPIASYIQELIDNLPGKNITIDFSPTDNPIVPIKMQLINRCLTNLLLNANRYSSHAWVSISSSAKSCEIIVDDDGPGIPKDKWEQVFQPFYREDAARNLNEGGAGLGLSIVRDAVRSHGGRVRLDQAPQGGLRVIITLPRS
jgi:two-component system osmolarity sensor histidine kinase EnvZ